MKTVIAANGWYPAFKWNGGVGSIAVTATAGTATVKLMRCPFELDPSDEDNYVEHASTSEDTPTTYDLTTSTPEAAIIEFGPCYFAWKVESQSSLAGNAFLSHEDEAFNPQRLELTTITPA